MVMIKILLLISIILDCSLHSLQAQENFSCAAAPWPWRFPRDHGRHDDFQTEWWYFTGNLQDAKGREFGFQLTFFRRALTPDKPSRQSEWAFRDLYAAHFAISDVKRERFFYDQRVARSALEIAGAMPETLEAHLQSWRMTQENDTVKLSAAAEFGAIELALENHLPPALHGDRGLAMKGGQAGQASYYYSLPHLPTRGTLKLESESFEIRGISWMDHEFGSNQLAPGDVGWDWFALHLPDSVEVMIYLLRRADGSYAPYSAGSLMQGGRVSKPLAFVDLKCTPLHWWNSALSGARYPIEWGVRFADYDLTVRAAFEHQELDTRRTTGVIYWEGCVSVAGEKAGKPVNGRGYLEMTGYAPSAAPRF